MSVKPILPFPDKATFVLFGAAGDLAWRLVVPALFNLYLDQQLPDDFRLIGVDRELDDTTLAARLRDGIEHFSRRGAPNPEEWDDFAAAIHTHAMDLNDVQGYQGLKALLAAPRGDHDEAIVFYLAIPPSLFGAVAGGLAAAGLARDRQRARIVVEKPLGRDLESFERINETLAAHFRESQIYRIDHFLGKETVQNILAMRFANAIFEPIWNRRYIDHVPSPWQRPWASDTAQATMNRQVHCATWCRTTCCRSCA